MTAAEIYKQFQEQKIKEVHIRYAGSEDSGGFEEGKIIFDGGEEEEITDSNTSLINALEEILYGITGADFNNDGCGGDAKFIKTDESVIKLECNHHTYFTDSEQTNFDEVIVDPAGEEYL